MTRVRRPLVALCTMLVLVVVQAFLDPTGLLALVGWSGALPRLEAGLWPFATIAVFVPVLLAVTWWVAACAGDRYWTLVPGIVLAVMLAQAAACLAMTWDAATAAWAAGYVTAKAVPVALVVAAVARWFGGPVERRVEARGSVWVPAVLFAAIAPFVAGVWWTGAVYAPGVPAARPDRGAVSVILGMLLLAGAAWLCLRWMRPRVRGGLGGWFGVYVSGGLVGPLQGGVAVGVAAVVADRLAEGRAARVPKIAAAAAAVVALVAAIAMPSLSAAVASEGDAAAAAPADAGAVPDAFLRAEGRRITDGEGNQVLLRGVNVNQLVDFYQPQPDVPATRPFTGDDVAGLAAQGFDVIRLNVWGSALEPGRGELGEACPDRVHHGVEWADDDGVCVVLDMHQDGWWNGAAPEGAECRAGRSPMWGYDGAPEWAT